MQPKIITKPLRETTHSSNELKNSKLHNEKLMPLKSTDSPFLEDNNFKTRIDYLTLKLFTTSDAQFESTIYLIKQWLTTLRIKVSKDKFNRKYFDDGILLESTDVKVHYCGAIKWNADKQFIIVELTGYACELINISQCYFFPLLELMERNRFEIKRVDIALDDFSSRYNIRFIQKKYSSGGFSPSSGPKPTRENISSSTGRTIYIGSKNASKQMVIYEKGKQLQLPKDSQEYQSWTRHELRLRGNKNIIIPGDVLTCPDSYFLNAYPKVYRCMLKGVEARSIAREIKTRCNAVRDKGLENLSKQYGPTLLFAKQTLTEKEIIQKTMRPAKRFQPSLPLSMMVS